MIRGGLFILVVCVLGLALGVAAIGEARIAYVAPELLTTSAPCAPPGQVAAWKIVSGTERDWYFHQWRAAKEPSLYLASLDGQKTRITTYRFSWLRSFHSPVFVRIDQTPGGTMRLTAKLLSGKGGYDPGVIAKQMARDLSPAEQAQVHAILDQTRVLDLPATDCTLGSDGAEWIFEAGGPAGYRYVNRWTPKDGPVREAGVVFLSLTGWKLDPIY